MSLIEQSGLVIPASGGGGGFTAKSIVFDFNSDYLGAARGTRQMSFYFEGAKIPLTEAGSDYTVHGTEGASLNWDLLNTFDTSLSLVLGDANTSWLTTDALGVRAAITITAGPITFDSIIFDNWHASGTNSDRGLKGAVITITEDTGVISDTYNTAVPGGTVIFTGDLPQHVALDIPQEYDIPLT